MMMMIMHSGAPSLQYGEQTHMDSRLLQRMTVSEWDETIAGRHPGMCVRVDMQRVHISNARDNGM